MVKIVVIGAAGRMGQAIIRAARNAPGVSIVGAVDVPGCPATGNDSGQTAGIKPNGVVISSNLEAVASEADVLIDFSFHESAPRHAAIAARLRKPLIIGTTGLTEPERAELARAAQSVPVVQAPNMSIGVNLLFSLVRKAAAVLGVNYDVEIVEMHHRLKKDAPSGTALRLGECVAEGRGQRFREVAVHGREGQVGERPVGQIGMHALRGGDTIGDHTVTFAVEGERVEFTHKASTRDAFATGALRAAEWALGRPPRLYDMQDVLGL